MLDHKIHESIRPVSTHSHWLRRDYHQTKVGVSKTVMGPAPVTVDEDLAAFILEDRRGRRADNKLFKASLVSEEEE